VNTKIIIRNPGIEIPDRLLTDGELLLDLTETESLSLYNNVFELNDLQTIKISGTLNFNIQATELNRLLFWNGYNPNRLCNDEKYFDVDVIADCFILEFRKLYYNSYDDSTKGINVVLDFDDSHWLKKIKEIKISDLDYGPKFAFTHANIVDNWENNYFYEDGKKAYHFPVAVYGSTVVRNFSKGDTALHPNIYTLSNLRPWVSLKFLLQKGFCEAGWTLKTSLDETDFYKRIWCYLLKPDFYKTDVKTDRGSLLRFEVEKSAGNIYDFVVQFDTKAAPNHDLNDNFVIGTGDGVAFVDETTAGYWKNPLQHTIEMNFVASFVIDNYVPNPSMTIYFRTFDLDTKITNQEFTHTFDIVSGVQNIVAEQSINVQYNEGVYVLIGGLVKNKPGSKFKAELATGLYMNGDNVDINIALDDYNIEDLFASFLHLINGKLYTDSLTQTVYVYPELRTNLYDGTDIEGYFNEAGEDITDKVISDSYKHSLNRSEIERYLILKFKDSTDPYIRNKNLDKTLHSKEIDYKLKNDNKKTFENKLFEPTIDRSLTTFSGTENVYNDIIVPYLSDSEQEQLAYAIKPRIAISVGYVSQQDYDKETGIAKVPDSEIYWALDKADHLQGNHVNELRTAIPLITQKANYFINITGDIVKANLCFGDDSNDLFYMFYYAYLNFLRNEKASFLMNIDPEYFFKNPFRHIKSFEYEGNTIKMLMTGINDFKLNENISTPVEMVPYNRTTKKHKCNCQYSKCVFYQPWTEVTYPEPDAYEISSLKIDGVEKLSSPVNLGALNVITLDAFFYVTNIVDAINSIGLNEITAHYFVDVNENEEKKRFKIEFLNCLFFEIIIKQISPSVNYLRYTNRGINDWNSSLSKWKYKYDGTGDSLVRYDAYGCESVNKINDCI